VLAIAPGFSVREALVGALGGLVAGLF
jgi:hypothetical protein